MKSQVVLLLLFFQVLHSILGQTCDENGVCLSNNYQCGRPSAWCRQTQSSETTTTRKSSSSSIYRHGGTAQAYTPEAPISSTVCDPEANQRNYRYRVAHWPVWRSSLPSAPTVDLTISVWSCDSATTTTSDASTTGPSCCCQPLVGDKKKDSAAVSIEVWQARPDGTYSSLRQSSSAHHRQDCRARALLNPGTSTTTLTTVAPGSTGTMGGLGPSGWDFPPFGPPFIHFYVKAPGHESLLIDLPFLLHGNSLSQKSFFGGDWRGSAWMKEYCKDKPFEIQKWVGKAKKNHVDVELNIYLTKLPNDVYESPQWCPSMLYGLPSSFFLEPMSICARPLLDFFPI